jgi:hypothetical protein
MQKQWQNRQKIDKNLNLRAEIPSNHAKLNAIYPSY